MLTLSTRFRDRVTEVDHYFKLLDAFNAHVVSGSANWRDGKRRLPKVLSDDLTLKMLKATSFLMLYNLTEATVRDAVEAIWAEVRNAEATPLELAPALQEVWVSAEFRRKDLFSAAPSVFRELAVDILNGITNGVVPHVSFKNVMPGGNIGNASIKSMCRAHGVSFTAPKGTRDGSDLETVKGRRNVLAHGEQSFEEIGSSYTVSDLKEIRLRSLAYLRQYVRRVDKYIADSAFKAA